MLLLSAGVCVCVCVFNSYLYQWKLGIFSQKRNDILLELKIEIIAQNKGHDCWKEFEDFGLVQWHYHYQTIKKQWAGSLRLN